MHAEGFKQIHYKEYICWIQVKIHISDQTSLRICNSVTQFAAFTLVTENLPSFLTPCFVHRVDAKAPLFKKGLWSRFYSTHKNLLCIQQVIKATVN
jgi:hypothetical protein